MRQMGRRVAYSGWTSVCRPQGSRLYSSRLYSSRMHVPSDSFGGRSPEKHAALMLENLFTFCACKIVLAQMQGDGRGELGSFGGDQYVTLTQFMAEHPLSSGSVNSTEWIEKLLRVDRGLAVRIILVCC